MTEYRIVEKAAFTVIGKKRRFSMEGSYSEIPKFWQEHMSDNSIVHGMYGICLDSDSKHFDYLIADNYDPRQEVPEGYETRHSGT